MGVLADGELALWFERKPFDVGFLPLSPQGGIWSGLPESNRPLQLGRLLPRLEVARERVRTGRAWYRLPAAERF